MNKHFCYNSPFDMVDKDGNKYKLTVERDDCADSPREWSTLSSMACWHSRYTLGDPLRYKNPDDFLSAVIKLYVRKATVEAYIKEGRSKYCKIENAAVYNKGADEKWYFVMHHDDACSFEDLIDCLAYEDTTKLIAESDDILLMPLYLLDHGSISISTKDFDVRWDSGQIGFAYTTKESALKWFGKEENWKEKAKEAIEGEIETYDQYLNGDVYYYKLEKFIHCKNETVCSHCGEVIKVDEYDDWKEINSCGDFYGDCLEDNGILDTVGSDLEFVD